MKPRIWRQFRYACGEGLAWAIREPVWWWSALGGISTCLQHRSPVPWQIYYAWMKLARDIVANRAKACDDLPAAKADEVRRAQE
jgi:hypothetical protein